MSDKSKVYAEKHKTIRVRGPRSGFCGPSGWGKANNLNNLNKAMRAGLASHGGTEATEVLANNLNNPRSRG